MRSTRSEAAVSGISDNQVLQSCLPPQYEVRFV